MPTRKLLRQRKPSSSLPLYVGENNNNGSFRSPNNGSNFAPQQQPLPRHKPKRHHGCSFQCIVATASIGILTMFGLWKSAHMLFSDDPTGTNKHYNRFSQTFRRQEHQHKNVGGFFGVFRSTSSSDAMTTSQQKTTTATATMACHSFVPPHRWIETAVVNDNYCDCANGSDEPNMAACSAVLVHQAIFDCGDYPNNTAHATAEDKHHHHHQDNSNNNNHHRNHYQSNSHSDKNSTWIFASRVGDGIVDCPNGRDEPGIAVADRLV